MDFAKDDSKETKRTRARALIIVAHPDDETIWMGGTILRNKNTDWTCFSLCRASDKDRAPKFRKVCAYYGMDPVMADLDDEGKLDMEEGEREAEKIIKEKMGGRKFDYIFTHSANGEYGHPVHIEVHNAVKNLLTKKDIKTERVFYFNYEKSPEGKMVPGRNSGLFVRLTPAEIKEKKRIVSEMYGYPPDGIDVGYCTETEVFK